MVGVGGGEGGQEWDAARASEHQKCMTAIVFAVENLNIEFLRTPPGVVLLIYWLQMVPCIEKPWKIFCRN